MKKLNTVLAGFALSVFLGVSMVATVANANANVSDIAEVANELHPPMNEVEKELHPDSDVSRQSPTMREETNYFRPKNN
ncbi:Hypothetical protein LUCI_2670 [Lucifera butyrica]|uniref:Uncharacterized protein n=1 Tax=Lucifera butyrica TaxID=1351585 RepID=A0A498R7R4_9FIRM|nr:hypothetical protein [Lucifera butyrica]VBB07421.1 Hypothetical protein LUCI_2670 [Lucifera butyrica]